MVGQILGYLKVKIVFAILSFFSQSRLSLRVPKPVPGYILVKNLNLQYIDIIGDKFKFLNRGLRRGNLRPLWFIDFGEPISGKISAMNLNFHLVELIKKSQIH